MPVINSFTILVEEAKIKNNNMNGSFQFNPQINAVIKNTNEKYSLSVSVKVENSDEKQFPIDLYAKVTGIFTFSKEERETIICFMKEEAFQMVYPYLRTVVTNLTSLALVNPLILPIINSEKLINYVEE